MNHIMQHTYDVTAMEYKKVEYIVILSNVIIMTHVLPFNDTRKCIERLYNIQKIIYIWRY